MLLFRNKSIRIGLFKRFLLFRVAITLAFNMQATLVCYYVYKITYDPILHRGDPVSLGLMGLWEVLPAVGFSLISGHFVDIMEKRGMVLKCVIAYLGLAVFYLLLSWTGGPIMGQNHLLTFTYIGIFLGGIIRAFISPAAFALIGSILPKKLLPNAATWSSTAWQIGFVLGPLLAGFLIAVGGFTLSFTVLIITECIALAAILSIPVQPLIKKAKEPIAKSLIEGLKFVYNSQIILASLSLDMFAVLFGGAVALLPVYANELLNIGEIGFGWLRAAPGIGSIIMLIILSYKPLKYKPGMKMLMGIAGFGITTIIFGVCHLLTSTAIIGQLGGCNISWAFILAFFMLCLGGMCDAISVVIRSIILQTHTPTEMRGRIAAVNTMFISSSNELGAMESGFTAKLMGTVPAVVFGGIMTLGVVITTYFKAPKIRSLKLTPEEDQNT